MNLLCIVMEFADGGDLQVFIFLKLEINRKSQKEYE
jgi:hypothetical protein